MSKFLFDMFAFYPELQSRFNKVSNAVHYLHWHHIIHNLNGNLNPLNLSGISLQYNNHRLFSFPLCLLWRLGPVRWICGCFCRAVKISPTEDKTQSWHVWTEIICDLVHVRGVGVGVRVWDCVCVCVSGSEVVDDHEFCRLWLFWSRRHTQHIPRQSKQRDHVTKLLFLSETKPQLWKDEM